VKGDALRKALSLHGLTPRQASIAFWLGLALSFVLAVLGAFDAMPLRAIDNALLDRLVRTDASTPRHQAVVIDIDESSVAAVGQWPWPRYRLARLIDQVAAQHPAAIALDIVLPEPDRTSLANLQQTYKRDFGVDLSIGGLPGDMLDNDGYLGSEIARTGTIASDYFYFDHTTSEATPPRPGVGFDGRTDLLALAVAPGVMMNEAAIASQSRVSGFVNAKPDADGMLRRLPMLISYGGVLHPSLALAAAMRRLGVASGTIVRDAGSLAIRVGGHRIPIDDAGYALLGFEGDASAYDAISAVDVLNGALPRGALAGKTVFIGSSLVGRNDIHRTAVDPRFPGARIQSVMTEAILGDRLVATPAWGHLASGVLCIVVGLALSAFFLIGSGLGLAWASGLAAVALLLASSLSYATARVLLPVGAPLALVVLLFACFLVASVALDQRRANVLRRRLENARRVTMESMAAVAETRDPETGAHIKRTQHYVRAIAVELRRRRYHDDLLTDEYIDLLFGSAPLHDIGKVGVPDHILLKPGKLTFDEMETMKQHAEFGRQIILHATDHLEGENFLVIAGEIAATHHEKWDGTGYPQGLSGADIPLSGRIMAIADIYDALISRRCYKEPFTHAHAMTLIGAMRGSTFDPAVLDAFVGIEAEIVRIAAHFRDEEGLAAAPVSLAGLEAETVD
jgi:HD-GYP domain-containing protein (c-di-GMP phosphodiesterase class II)